MPRTARLDAPGEIHHVWARGLERREIFLDSFDRLDLVGRLGTILPETGVQCLAWSLLPNHYHLVLKRAHVSLSCVMARINTGFALRFNRRHERSGFLFQNRFGSRIVDDDSDLLATVRYVVRNPMKHGLCADEEELDRYEWGSLSGIRGHRALHPFERPSATRRILEGQGEPAAKSLDGREGVRSQRATDPSRDRLRDLEDRIVEVCASLEVEPNDVLSGRRGARICEARALLCWVAVNQLGLSGSSAAARLGISRSGVSRAIARGRALAETGGSAD